MENEIKPVSWINYTLIIWFLILMFGPYVPNNLAPLRIDHLLSPAAGALIVIFVMFRHKKIIIPKCLIPFLLFMITGIYATIYALNTHDFYIEKVNVISAFDTHLRIVLTFMLALIIMRKTSIQWSHVITVLFYSAVVLAVFAILQVMTLPEALDIPIYNFTVDYFTGRHDRELSVVQLCANWRAVSTFYHPGNFALFSAFAASLFVIARPLIRTTMISYFCGMFLIILGLSLTLSKGFLMGSGMLLLYLIVSFKWRAALQFILIFILALGLSFTISNRAVHAFYTLVVPGDTVSFYNRFLGSRFGDIVRKKTGIPEKEKSSEKSSEEKAVPEKVKPEVITLHLDEAVPEEKTESEHLEIKFTPLNDNAGKPAVDETAPQKGYLLSTLGIISKYPAAGVGYVSNADYGDSMVVHIMVRGGSIGMVLFIIFLLWICFRILKNRRSALQPEKTVYEAWVFAAIMFFVWGVGFPTFIQDRTADIFWWMGALLACGGYNPEKVKPWVISAE